MFITIDDMKVQIRQENLDVIAPTAVLNTAIEVAIQIVKDHLYLRYDTNTIFAATGTARNQSIVDACVSIALFKLYKRLPQRKQPEWLAQEYDETLSFLNGVADGRIGLSAPRRESDSEPSPSKIRFSTRTPRDL